jgi:hypothetical protein
VTVAPAIAAPAESRTVPDSVPTATFTAGVSPRMTATKSMPERACPPTKASPPAYGFALLANA